MKLGTGEIILIIIAIFCIILPFKALIDILKSKFNGNDKLIWVIVVLLVPIIGAILYFRIGKKSKIV